MAHHMTSKVLINTISLFNHSNANLFLVTFAGKPYYPRIEDHIAEESGGYVDGLALPINSPARSSPQSQNSDVNERFSRKVFVGGLPPDIDEGMPSFIF